MNIFKIKTAKEFAELQADRDAVVKKLEEAENTITNLQNMSKDVMEAKADYDKTIETLKAEHEKALNEAKTANETLKTENEKTVAQLKADHEKALADMKADYEKQMSGMTTIVEVEKQSAEVKAQKIVASIGVPEAELPKATSKPLAAEDILNTFKSLKGTEQHKFYAEHRDAILKEIGLNK